MRRAMEVVNGCVGTDSHKLVLSASFGFGGVGMLCLGVGSATNSPAAMLIGVVLSWLPVLATATLGCMSERDTQQSAQTALMQSLVTAPPVILGELKDSLGAAIV